MRVAAFILVTFGMAGAVGCGGGNQAPPAATPPTPEAPASSVAPTPSAEPEPASAKDGAPATETEESPPASSGDSGASDSAQAEREVKYIVSGSKLEIRVGGVRFRPSAKAIRVGAGWGVRLSVEGEAEDDKLHSILTPKAQALAFAGKVTRKGAEETLSDERAGDDETVVAPGTPAKIEREWPGKGGKPLAAGDKLELHVGLWGLGTDAASRRPVKRFLILSMRVDKGEPRPMLAPPQ